MKLSNMLAGIRGLLPFDNKWQLIFDRLFFKRSNLLVYKIGGLEFLIDHDAGDHNGTRLCIISDIYKRFLPRMELDTTLSVLDLGANGGGFPLMLLLNGKRLSKLVCVEMNPNTFRRLQFNISRNVEGEVVLVHGAVCDTRKTLQLSLGQGDISDSIYQSHPIDPSQNLKTYTIAGYSFDDLFRAQFGDGVVDICKMDIEGAEYEVLSSSEHTGLRRCRYLIIEVHPAPANQLRQLMDALAAIGFVEISGSDNRFPCEHLFRNERLSGHNP